MTKGNIPTSTRRKIEKKTTSQSSAEAPSYTTGAVGLSIVSEHVQMDGVGGIMVLCVTCLYPPVLTLRTDHCHYKPGILLLACFFDQIYRNPFSTSSKLWLLVHIIYCWKGIHEIAAPLESKETVQ